MALPLIVLVLSASSLCPARCSADGTAVSAVREASSMFLERKVTLRPARTSPHSSLDFMLLAGDSNSDQSKLAAIEQKIWQTFEALPRNRLGHLAPRAVRYIVHSYFVQEHGWLIKGLEPHGMMPNMTEVHEVSILQDKVPAIVESLVENQRSGHGLSLSDVVAMIATLEQLIFDESVELLQDAYALNNKSVTEDIDESSAHEVLRSYLLLFGEGAHTRNDFAVHHVAKGQAAELTESWGDLVDFEQDALLNWGFAKRHQTNPFMPARYSFTAVSAVVQNIARDYGKWQNEECKHMQAELEDLDIDGTGRVPLNSFYSQQDGATYQFRESVEYLRKIGALDESVPYKPQVLIVNYITGPSNCIASFPYYSVCCLSACPTLLSKLEALVQASSASPEQLLKHIGQLSDLEDGAPRPVTEVLTQKLHEIAATHQGKVPLHGRLFAQWLHFAYPTVCPYPAIVRDSKVFAAERWQMITPENFAEHTDRLKKSSVAEDAASDPLPYMAQWTDEERLPAEEPTWFSCYMLVELLLLLVAWLGGAVAWFGVFRRTACMLGDYLPFTKYVKQKGVH